MFWFLGNVIIFLMFFVLVKNIIILLRLNVKLLCGGGLNLNVCNKYLNFLLIIFFVRLSVLNIFF